MDIDKNIKKAVEALYDNSTYSDKYGLQIWIVVIITLIVILACCYYYVLNNLQPIKANWNEEKCNPAYIPFAGLIHDKKGDEFWSFTAQNFNGCINTILQQITNYAFLPFYYAMNVISSIFLMLVNALAVMREMFYKMRSSVANITSVIFDRIFNITAPILELFVIIKSIIAKVVGTFSAVIYTLLASYLGLQSFFGFIIQLLTDILYAIVAIIVALLILSWIPGVFPIALGFSVAMAGMIIVIIIIQAFMSNILHIHSSGLPSVPDMTQTFCFDKNTKVVLQNGKEKMFCKMKIGDVLQDGSIIAGVIKLMIGDNKMYNLDGILVTGKHKVFHREKGWISVDEHENAQIVSEYSEKFVYCIITNTKRISIKNHVFLDWDEIDEHTFDILYKNCPLLPTGTEIKDINSYMVSGIHGDTNIKLMDGTNSKLRDIQPYDILEDGDKVFGIIKIDAKSVNMNADNCIDNKNYLYHLVTDSGMFMCDGIKIKDFNSYIESYLY
jgi:hypothetical protein